MESPPPYSPKKKTSTGLIIALVIGGVVLCCVLPIGGIAGAGFWGINKIKGVATCAIGFEQIRDSVNAYAKANNGKLPTANKWMDQVRPFYAKEVSKVEGNPFGAIPADSIWACTNEDGTKTGIAFNSDLSGKNLKDIQDHVATIVIFEIEKPAANAAESYKARPKATSPKMFGNPRGWFYAPLEGDIKGSDFGDSSGRSRTRVEVKKD
ncbi:MAG: hypothetical protein ACO1SV_23760 [Fimbriimonas sp.]